MENNQADPQLYTLPEANLPQIADDKPGKNFDYKALVAFLILFVVGLLMLLAYLFTQVQQLRQQAEVTEFKEPKTAEEVAEQVQADPTTGWETYSNTEFRFKYPIGWDTLKLGQNSETLMIAPQASVDIVKVIEGGFGGGPFLVMLLNTNTIEPKPASDEFQSVIESINTVNGNIAKEYFTTVLLSSPLGDPGDQLREVVLEHKGTYYSFKLLDQVYSSEFNIILSTFEFVD